MTRLHVSDSDAFWRHQVTYALSILGITIAVFSVTQASNHVLSCTSGGHNATNDAASTAVTVAPRNMTHLNITMAFLTHLTNNGKGKHFGGAFFLAMDDLNKIAAEKGYPVSFSYRFRDTTNQEPRAMREMADLYCRGEVSAFIGPDVYCKSAGLMATAYDIPYVTFACGDKHNATSPHLIVNTENYIIYISRFIGAVLQHYKWRSFWLVTGLSIKWQNTAELLRTTAAARNISLNGETEIDMNDHYSNSLQELRRYRKTLQVSRHHTRVYVFLGEYDSLLMFLREMQSLGMTNTGDYAVIAGDDGTGNHSGPLFYLTSFERDNYKGRGPEEVREKTQMENAAFQNTVVIRPINNNVDKEEFEERVYKRNMLPPIDLPRPPPKLNIKTVNVPIQAYHLYDATMFYGGAVMALMATPEADPTSGSQIIQYLRCRYHKSIQGSDVWIHSNGETEGTYTVQGRAFKDGTMLPKLSKIGTFLTDRDKDVVFEPQLAVVWTKGQPPVSNPECGFDGQACPSDKLSDWKIAVIVAAVVLSVVILVLSLGWSIKHYMYEQKLERLAWKIERDEIQPLNAGQELIAPSRPKKKDSSSSNQLRFLLLSQDPDSDSNNEATHQSEILPVGIYKGTNVVVKQLTRKHLELTRALKKQMQLRKELTHENINRFIGACIEVPHVYIVTQHCPRKSLQDILMDDNSPLDDMFITSLVQDLIRGMSFIHEGEFGYHGNLKSSNCLVDSRWTLKIADFGLSALGPPPRMMFEDEESFRGLLWTAPELLRQRRNTRNISHHHHHHYYPYHHQSSNSIQNHSSLSVMDQQKGDIYSFAIILYELYGKNGPWGQTDISNREIIERLSIQTTPVFRPETSSLSCNVNIINLIQACWNEDPHFRPDFKENIRSRFKPIQQELLKSNIFDNMLAMMEKYANNLEVVVAERTEQLRLEKIMTENLLLRMLPRSVAESLKRGERVEPEWYEQVSIYFSDIVGFTELSAESSPLEIVNLLNELYTCFDFIIEGFDVYKVETIGDAYMVVSGLPIRNGDTHAGEIASMSLLLLEAIKQKRFKIKGQSNNLLKIRIGIHSGPCCAGVVGLKMPRYCLFGDTVNTASRLETTGEALKIHCSSECKKILDKLGGYRIEQRGYIEMKGKGSLLTYFLMSEDHQHRHKRIIRHKKMGNGGRCVSASNLDYSCKIYSFKPGHIARAQQSPWHPTKDSCPNDKQSAASSLNTSLDSTWSEVPEEMKLNQQSNHMSPPTSPHEFTSSTLPRAAVPKYNNIAMSPIAEDPFSAEELSPLEKTVSFPNSTLHHSQMSETEALLGDGLGQPYIQLKSIPNKRSLSSRSVMMNSTKRNGLGGTTNGSRRESDSSVKYQTSMVDCSSPETVL